MTDQNKNDDSEANAKVPDSSSLDEDPVAAGDLEDPADRLCLSSTSVTPEKIVAEPKVVVDLPAFGTSAPPDNNPP